MKAMILTLFMIFAATQLKAEDRIKIAVIDSGISFSQSTADYACKDGHVSYIDDTIYVRHRHGENIISILAPAVNPKTHCIKSFKVYRDVNALGDSSVDATIKALKAITKDYQVKFVNISMGGGGTNFNEKRYIKRLLIRGVQIAVSAGNNGQNLDKNCDYFPACYKKTLDSYHFYVVGSSLPSSNRGQVVTDTYSGKDVGTPVLSGTSQATAQKMVFLLKSMVYSNRRLNERLQQTNTRNRKNRNYR